MAASSVVSSSSRPQGYGCMGLSVFYGTTPSEEQSIAVIRAAIESKVALLNSATFYGPLHRDGFGHNLRLIGKAIKGIDRASFKLMVKIGMDTRAPPEELGKKWHMSGAAQHLRDDVDYALKQLETDYIDIIVLCRVPTDVTIEEAVTNMKTLVDEGKARHIALSEASADTIRRAAKVAPIYCIEQEWSLWARDAEPEIVPTCRELGIKIVAYSPLGRGFLTGSIQNRDDLPDNDYRKTLQPKFAEGNFQKNKALLDAVTAIAQRHNISVGQLSLAWLHHQGDDVIPIPGTGKIDHLKSNLAARDVNLTADDLAEINRIFALDASVGDRYPHKALTFEGNKPGAAVAAAHH